MQSFGACFKTAKDCYLTKDCGDTSEFTPAGTKNIFRAIEAANGPGPERAYNEGYVQCVIDATLKNNDCRYDKGMKDGECDKQFFKDINLKCPAKSEEAAVFTSFKAMADLNALAGCTMDPRPSFAKECPSQTGEK